MIADMEHCSTTIRDLNKVHKIKGKLHLHPPEVCVSFTDLTPVLGVITQTPIQLITGFKIVLKNYNCPLNCLATRISNTHYMLLC